MLLWRRREDSVSRTDTLGDFPRTKRSKNHFIDCRDQVWSTILAKMGIPVSFYLHYWLTNSFMAAALGFLAGLLMPDPRLFVLTVILAFLFYQISAYRHFWGREKGHFEYYYREFLINQAAKSLIHKIIGIPEILWEYPSQYYPKILGRLEVEADPNLLFIAYLKAAQAALKEYDCRKEIEYLRKAVSLHSKDLVANFWLANAMERVGNAPAAISAYQAALSDPSLDSAELREFIAAQIKRVESQGPTQKPPIPGLRHMVY